LPPDDGTGKYSFTKKALDTTKFLFYARVVASQIILGIFQKFSFSPGFEPWTSRPSG